MTASSIITETKDIAKAMVWMEQQKAASESSPDDLLRMHMKDHGPTKLMGLIRPRLASCSHDPVSIPQPFKLPNRNITSPTETTDITANLSALCLPFSLAATRIEALNIQGSNPSG